MQCKASRSDDCMETCMDALILRVQEAQEQCVEGRAPKVGALGDAGTPTGRRW